MDEQQRFCPSCGMPNPAGATTCATCGRPLAAASTQPGSESAPSEAGASLPPPPTPARPVPPPAPAPPAAAPPPIPPPTMYPPPMAPVPFPAAERQQSGGQKTGQFFGGLGLGLAGFAAIVLVTILANSAFFSLAGGNGTNFTPFVAIVLFLALIGVMTYLLARPRTRWLGYGVLTAVVALPVIAVVGCVVILSVAFRG